MNNRTKRAFFGLCAGAAVSLGGAAQTATAQTYAQFAAQGYKLPMIMRGVLPNVEGRIDHVAFDPKSGRTYVACSKNGTLECVDASGLKVAQTIKDLPEPLGIVFLAEQRQLALTCGDGSVLIFKVDNDGKLDEKPTKVELRGEADPIRYDDKAKKLWVGHGYMLSWVDPATGKSGGEVKLPEAPEGFVLDPGSSRVFVNLPKKGEIAVIDREKGTITANWALKDIKGNYPMALDAANGRLFVAARDPAKLLVLDIKDGKEIARLDIASDADDCWYDIPGKRIYVSCGGSGGKVAMILQESPDKYSVEHMEGTAAGARTSLLIPERRRLVVLAPKLGDQQTFVYTYILPP